MQAHKHIVPVLTALTCITLVGLIVVQAYLLNSAYEIKEQAFARTVESALMATALRMQAGETLTQVLRISGQHGACGTQMLFTQFNSAAKDTSELSGRASLHAARVVVDSLRFNDSAFSYRTMSAPTVDVDVSRAYASDTVTTIFGLTKGGSRAVLATSLPDSVRAMFVSTVLENLQANDLRPLTERIDAQRLDSVLRQSFRESGIHLEYTWGVVTSSADSTRQDTVRMAHPNDAAASLRSSDLRTPLSPFEETGRRDQLVVNFPGRSVYVLSQIWPALAASAFFITLLTLSFLYTIRTILRQQRLAMHMVDFVNTMTHEFKTPLSTVTLATEAISRPDVVGRKTKVLQYSRMIADEAARMKLHADRILQLAQLETGELELRCSPVNMHELIRTTASAFALQVETRSGTLSLELDADDDRVNGDAVHLANVLYNVLDNANKYSPGAPHITLRTERRNSLFVVRIADDGIGIAPEHHERVFDRFYRVPKGNLHDVKGFGIGLSYVKLIMLAHGGCAELESSPGAGTTIALSLPLLHAHGAGLQAPHT